MRPKNRSEDQVRRDIKYMGIDGWKEEVKKRDIGEMLLRKQGDIKTCNGQVQENGE